MPQAESLYIDRYDVKAGRWPQNSNECILVLTSEGKISDYLLYVLGLRDPNKVDSFISEFISGSDVETENLDGLSFAYEEFLGMLIVISVVLTTIGGIIPAHNASKSDPVEALRTE